MNENLLIIGGVAAGLAAAMEARRRSPDAEIAVLERTLDVSYGACGLPYVIAGLIPSLDRLVVHAPDYFIDRHNIRLHLQSDVEEILPAKSVVRARTGGELREIGYTRLVIATGAAAVCPPLPGHELEGVLVLRHMKDGRRAVEYLERRRPRRAVVVGAGYIGLEMAEAFHARGLHTTVIEASDRVMSTLGGRLRDRVADELRSRGVELIFGEKVVAFEGSNGRAGGVERVLTETGRVVEAEIVSIGVGVRPNAELARNAGIEMGESGAIKTDAEMRTNVTNIYAAGDCCEVLHRVSGRSVWFPLGQPAVRQGWVAGANALDESMPERYAGVVGTNVVKVFDLEVGRTGLSEGEALDAGLDASVIESETSSRAGYYPGGSKILTRLIFDRRGRLLGAQMTGREGVAQRIDVYAAALHANLKVEDIERFDLAYAPPYAPTIDPILRAAHKARKA
ncbi:MAG TPA: FAD-dependent oxidoreductase [Pyrinomonadaceae bacterium]|nr:FAD-dependent oxidoreductase [Pyrinomonadaceae bacterium]